MASVKRYAVKFGEIKLPQRANVEKYAPADGSFVARIYDRFKTDIKVRHDGYQNVLDVKEKKLLYNVTITRTALHSFYVVISDRFETVFKRCNDYAEINELLAPVIEKVKNCTF